MLFYKDNPVAYESYKKKERERRKRDTPERKAWRSEYEKNSPLVKANRTKQFHRRRSQIATFTLADWQAALAHFRNRCAYCEQPSDKFHQDHFIPVAKGGHYVKSNIVPACPSCNLKKNAKYPQKWLPRDKYLEITAYLAR